MKIKSISLENVTSYRERVQFMFEDTVNILIGPNGGGKSNLQRVLALILSKYFIQQYEFKRNDDEVGIDPVDPWKMAMLRRTLAPYLGCEQREQVIEIELAPDPADVENIRTIGENLDDLNERLAFWEWRRETYEPLSVADEIQESTSFTYRIRDFDLDEPEVGSAAWGYRQYLKTLFIYMRVAEGIPDVTLTSPLFFFFSERKADRNVEVQSNQLTEQQRHLGIRNVYHAAIGDSTNLMQWGAQHFARIHWKAVNEAAMTPGKVFREIFDQNADVQLLTQYLKELGYQWGFLHNPEAVTYPFALQRAKDEYPLTADKFSSGEREIVHFLLAMFALNVQDGVVLIDEPELHLHPRWQRIFLGLFQEIAPTRKNQFLIATHSPVFVSPETVDSVTRIYRSTGGGSDRVALREVELPDKRALVRMINSQNNERIFFADKVVLVEGIKDRLVITSLMEACANHFQNYEAIEIIEVGGKGNFSEYRKLLSGLRTPSFVIADLDYLLEVGAGSVAELFESRPDKEWDVLTSKKSKDAATAMRLLREAVASGATKELASFLDYLQSRRLRLKDRMSREQRRLLKSELTRLRGEDSFLLEGGEIEDYLPEGVSSVKSIVDMTVDPHWINRIPKRNRRAELIEIVGAILGTEEKPRSELRKAARRGDASFAT